MNKIAVVGAGISGLSIANYLEKHQLDYHIYERRKKDDLTGHGFLLPKEGIEYLSQIIEPTVLFKYGNFLKKYIRYSHKGKILAQKDLNDVFVISRSALISILARNIPAEKMSYEETVIPCPIQKGKLKKENGTYIDSDITIVSDGSKSRIRKEMFQEEIMKTVQENEIVNIIKCKDIAASLEDNFMKFHHEDGGLTFGILKLSEDTVLWYCQFDNKKYKISETSSVESLRNYMFEIFDDWEPMVSSIVKNSNYENVHLWRVYELEKLNPFYKDNTVFIGDAAHPLIPFTSQGVTSALKDSYVLTQYLASEKNFTNAFRKYEADRKPEIEIHIRNGRILLDQFLKPLDQQTENILPISYK